MPGGRRKGDGLGRLGGREKGTPNKKTAELREAINKIITDNMDEFNKRLAKCKPNEFCSIIVNLMKYALPSLQSISLKDEGDRKKDVIDVLIQLRDGNKSVMLNELEDENSDNENSNLNDK